MLRSTQQYKLHSINICSQLNNFLIKKGKQWKRVGKRFGPANSIRQFIHPKQQKALFCNCVCICRHRKSPLGSTGPQDSNHLVLATLHRNILLGPDPALTRVSLMISVGSLVRAWFCCGHWNYRAPRGPITFYPFLKWIKWCWAGTSLPTCPTASKGTFTKAFPSVCTNCSYSYRNGMNSAILLYFSLFLAKINAKK